jgi:hypothetical protein
MTNEDRWLTLNDIHPQLTADDPAPQPDEFLSHFNKFSRDRQCEHDVPALRRRDLGVREESGDWQITASMWIGTCSTCGRVIEFKADVL